MGTFAARSPVASSVCQFNHKKPASQLRGDPVCVSKVSFVSRRACLSSRFRASVEASDVGSSDKDTGIGTGAEVTPVFNPFAPGKISSRMAVKKPVREESSLPATATTTVAVTSEAPSSAATVSSTPTPQVSSPFAASPSATPSQIPSPSSPERAPAVRESILSSAKAFDLPEELSDSKAERHKARMTVAVRQERMARAKAIAVDAARKRAEAERMMMLLEDSESESDSEGGLISESESEVEEFDVSTIRPVREETFFEGINGFFSKLKEIDNFVVAMAIVVGIVIGSFVAADKLGAFNQVYTAFLEDSVIQ